MVFFIFFIFFVQCQNFTQFTRIHNVPIVVCINLISKDIFNQIQLFVNVWMMIGRKSIVMIFILSYTRVVWTTFLLSSCNFGSFTGHFIHLRIEVFTGTAWRRPKMFLIVFSFFNYSYGHKIIQMSRKRNQSLEFLFSNFYVFRFAMKKKINFAQFTSMNGGEYVTNFHFIV